MRSEHIFNIGLWFAVLLVGLIGSYATFLFLWAQQDSTYNQSVKGYYSYGFENHMFLPCNSEESWWVSDEKNGLDSYHQLAEENDELIYMEIRASVSNLGHFGHMGASDREVEVLEVLSARRGEMASCKVSPRNMPLHVERLISE